MRLSLCLCLALTFSACDFSDSPDGYDCVSGATLTAAVGGAAYTGDCVEVLLGGGVTLRTYSNKLAAGDYDRGFTLSIPSRAVGTYTVGPAGASVSAFARATASGSKVGTTDIDASSGQVVVTDASGGRVRGTFAVSGPETVNPTNGPEAPTGRAVPITGSFDAPG